MIEGKRN